MNYEEIQSLIDQLKASGLKDEEIMDVFWTAFSKGEMDRKDLETLAEAMGYELTDDFKNDEQPDPINSGADENAQGLSEKELEDAKAIDLAKLLKISKKKSMKLQKLKANLMKKKIAMNILIRKKTKTKTKKKVGKRLKNCSKYN